MEVACDEGTSTHAEPFQLYACPVGAPVGLVGVKGTFALSDPEYQLLTPFPPALPITLEEFH